MSTPSGEPPYPGPQPNQPGYDPHQQGYAPYPDGYQGPPPAGYGPGPQAPKNGLGIAALVLGILAILATITVIGVVLGIPLGLLAVILGIVGVLRVGKGLATNKGVAIAGIVTGALGLIASVAVVVLGATFFASTGGGDLVTCIQQAGSDRTQVLQCQEQYQQQVEDQLGGTGS